MNNYCYNCTRLDAVMCRLIKPIFTPTLEIKDDEVIQGKVICQK